MVEKLQEMFSFLAVDIQFNDIDATVIQRIF